MSHLQVWDISLRWRWAWPAMANRRGGIEEDMSEKEEEEAISAGSSELVCDTNQSLHIT